MQIRVGLSRRSGERLVARTLFTLASVVALGAAGCEWDSFFDPSTIGRWEHTPTVVPVLERMTAIETDDDQFVEYSDPSADDLVAEAFEYRLGPGDQLIITLFDDISTRAGPSEYPREIDIRGMVNLPQLGAIPLAGLTDNEARNRIAEALSKYVKDPLVEIVMAQKRQQTFTVMGAVEAPGPYFIPKPDYRLLEALTAAGRFPETTEDIYIIRQAPLDAAITGATPAAPAAEPSPGEVNPAPEILIPAPEAQPAKEPEKLIDLIDELTKPDEAKPDEATPAETEPKSPGGGASLGMVRGERPAVARGRQPVIEATDAAQPPAGEPVIDLVDDRQPPATAAMAPSSSGAGSWVFLNGKWVQVMKSAPSAGSDAASAGGDLVTQRVIRVPVKPLISGAAQYNIVVRAGDIIRVPQAPSGLIYVVGEVQRPGPYALPDVGRMTMLRAIDSAGGLSEIAIPERVDLTRVVGRGKQATIRLNLRSISEGTMPDIYMKADDRVNVGTNFWAYPLAIVRNALRFTYGFGFVIDRNFGNDVFGPPPENRSF